MSDVVLYTRPGCLLCQETLTWLSELGVSCKTIDVTGDVELYERYRHAVPVVVADGRVLSAPFTFETLSHFLGYVQPRGEAASGGARLASKIAAWLARHWLALINTFIAIYIGLPILAPVLMANGMERPAGAIYTLYRFMCHELPQRSYFIYGPRAVYSLEQLAEATHTKEWGAFPWPISLNAFVGNQEVGYKIALCQRDLAIYGAMLLSGLVFGFVRRRVKPLPFRLYLLLGLLPVALDGGSQLVSYFVSAWMPGVVPRESTWLLRTITGALFGWTSMWLALPTLQASFTSVDEQLAP